MGDKKNGRPSKYKKEYAEQARKLCLLGHTNEDLAKFFEVAVSTVSKWMVDHKEFSDAIKSGKAMADADIADKLYQRAMGYSHPEVKVFNNQGEIVTHDTIKHYAPDPTAAIFWLKNRQPKVWRDKQEQVHSGAIANVSYTKEDYEEAQGNLESKLNDLD